MMTEERRVEILSIAAALLIERLTDDELCALNIAVQVDWDARSATGYDRVQSLFYPNTGLLREDGFKDLFACEVLKRLRPEDEVDRRKAEEEQAEDPRWAELMERSSTTDERGQIHYPSPEQWLLIVAREMERLWAENTRLREALAWLSEMAGYAVEHLEPEWARHGGPGATNRSDLRNAISGAQAVLADSPPEQPNSPEDGTDLAP